MISCRSPQAVDSFGCSVAANVTRCLVETILAMSSDATRLQKLRLKNESAGMRRRSEAPSGRFFFFFLFYLYSYATKYIL